MRKIDQESTSGKIIRALGIGVGISFALANERTSYKMSKILIKKIFGLDKKPKNSYRSFYRLRKQKLIDVKKVGDQEIFYLTEGGRDVFLRFNYDNIKIKEPRIWDRNFRMVLFDIPEKKKKARNIFREKIKEMNFVRFNDSVWIYPYSCQEEIDFIANYLKIGKYVHFALVKDLTNRDYLEKYFRV